MAKLGINTGTAPNDNTGDSLLVGAIKINNNFNEIYTYLGAGSTTILSAPIWTTTNVGISTLRNVGVGTTNPTSALTVSGNVIVTGVLTATTFSGSISNAIYANNAGVATYSSTSGISTSTTKVSIGETNLGTNSVILASGASLGDNTLYIDSGLTYNAATNTLSATAFNGTATYATSAGIATYATSAGIATYATSADTATYASSSGIATYASSSGIATYASSSGIATYATSAGIATYASSSGIATYATSAGIATYASSSGIATYASSSGVSTVSEGLTGTPNIIVGIVTATSFIGDGSGLTGITASGSGIIIKDSGSTVGTAGTIDFGDNLTVSAVSAGVVTVTASSGSSSQWVTTAAGIHTLSNIGIGTTNPTSALTVKGNTSLETLSVSGVATAATLIDSIGNVRAIPQNSVGVAYTLTVTDVGKHVAISTGGITIPPSVFSIGDNVTLFNDSDYNQMITPGSGVTLRRAGVGDTGERGLNGYGLATILCINTNSFVITGAGLT